VIVMGQISELVDDEKVGAGISGDLPLTQLGRVAREIVEQLGGGAEQGGVTGVDGTTDVCSVFYGFT
jgi:hypothetical protein